MFYCNDCAKTKDWPETIFKSFGSCEICRENKECNEMPSKLLPLPKDYKVKDKQD